MLRKTIGQSNKTKFISFYSYKGGVGRTLTMVNVAAALAAEGKSVIIWDLDLEAPGIQTFPVFSRFELEKQVKKGMVDLLLEFQESGYELPANEEIQDSLCRIDPEFTTGKYAPLENIRFLTVGKLDKDYTSKYGGIKWNQLFDQNSNPGQHFFEYIHNALYELNDDFVLIDSRTGFTNIGLVSTIQLPDLVYLVFTYNEQNLHGLDTINSALRSNLVQKETRRFKLPVKSIATMADLENYQLLEERKKILKDRFKIVPHFEVAFHKPLVMLEEILTLTDTNRVLPATNEYVDIAGDILRFTPQRFIEEASKIAMPKPSFGSSRGYSDDRESDKNRKRSGHREELADVEKIGSEKTFVEKTADIFRVMDFQVETRKNFDDFTVDIFLKKQKSIGQRFEYYICRCVDWPAANPEIVDSTLSQTSQINIRLDQPCDTMIVSLYPLPPETLEMANNKNILCWTYDSLLNDLMDFDDYIDMLVQGYEGSPLEHLYIEQDVLPEKTLEAINIFDFVKKWLTRSDCKHFSLLGDYGTGKTSFSQTLAYRMAADYKNHDPNLRIEKGLRIPFLVDLRQCQKALSLDNLIYDQLQQANVKPLNVRAFLKLVEEGKILLIFDAFDEMATMSNAEVTLANFRQLNRTVNGDAKVILTSRTHYFRDDLEVREVLTAADGTGNRTRQGTLLSREIEGNPEYEIVYLKEFSDPQVREYLQKALANDWHEAYDKIEAVYNLHDLASRPVLLDMIVNTLPKIDTHKNGKEFNVVELYDIYTASWFSREDHRLQITKQGKEELVEGLASRLWQEGTDKIHYTALSDIISHHLKIKDKIRTTRDLETADYEVRTASFLVRDDEGNYRFAHKSFQEFFLARRIKKELEKNNTDVLDTRLFSLEVVFFLRHLVKEQQLLIERMAAVLAKSYRKNISENALFIYYSVIKMSCTDQRFAVDPAVPLDDSRAQELTECLEKNLPSAIFLPSALLSGISLSRMMFRKADFTGAQMKKNRFLHTRFMDVDFSRACLDSSDFRNSRFHHVNFNGTSASYGDFRDCVFRDCTFIQSDFRLSNFSRCRFQSCRIEGNDFTASGFLGSDMDFAVWQKRNNRLDGAGEPDGTVQTFSHLLDLGHEGPVNSVAVSPDNCRIVSGSSDSTVKVWDSDTGTLIHTLKGHDLSVNSVAVSPDNRRIVSGSDDSTVKVWDSDTGTLIHTLKGHDNLVLSVAVSPDNRRIVSGSDDRTVKVWDSDTGTLIHTLKGHEGIVFSAAASPDNLRIVSIDIFEKVKIWDAETGKLLETKKGKEHFKNAIPEQPKKTRLNAHSSYSTITTTEIETGKILYTLHLLPGDDYIILFPETKEYYPSSQDAMNFLYFTDKMARYPASDFPELQRRK